MKKKLYMTALLVFLLAMGVMVGCTNSKEAAQEDKKEEINIYTSRHYETDDQLYDQFTKETGIKVNVIKGEADELIERLSREGEGTSADVFITEDVARISLAKNKKLLQPVESDILEKNIPANLRDKDNEWFGVSVRGRVLVYDKNRVNPSELSTYEALTEPQWKGRVLARTSTNVYNQSLVASFLAINGEEATEKWAKGLVANFARDPKGNDRDQAKAVAAGEGDVAIMNTYYLGKMLNSTDPEEVKVAEQVGVFFPNQETTGTHINVSAMSMSKFSKNKESAQKFMEFLTTEKIQKEFAEANYEYPVNANVEPSALLKSWGEFKAQDINLTELGENNAKAVQIMNKVGWK